MATIYKRKRGDDSTSYFVVYWDGAGKRRWEQFDQDKPARARKAQVELELARSGGTWVPPTVMSFTEYSLQWEKRYADVAVRPRVAANYKRCLARARAAFGAVKLAGLSRSHVKAFLAERANAGCAASTIRNDLIPLRECLQHAVDDGLIPSNPATRVPIPGTRRRRIVPPTAEQVTKVLGKARQPDAFDVITVAASLGLRLGELFGLRWADVDFDSKLVRVRATNWRGEIEERTKTEAGDRVVPLFESARKVLAARKLRTRRYTRDVDPVFATAVGTPENPTNFERREFKRALKLAGLEGAFRFHDLRHFAVSTLIAQRADIKLLQAIAGHASATVTLDTYGHLMTERVTEAAGLYDPLTAKTAAAARRPGG